MLEIYFSLAKNINAKISSDRDFSFNDDDLLIANAYIPDLKIPDITPVNIDLTISHSESNAENLKCNSPYNIEINAIWNGTLPKEIFHLLYGMLRRNLFSQGQYCVHSACLVGNKNVLILGHSGSGKTSIALNLIEKHNLKMLSGNKTIISIDSKRIIANHGTSTLTLKAADAEKLPASKILYYWDRCAAMPSAEIFCKKPTNIDHIIIARINDAQDSCELLNSSSALHNIFPFFLDCVNADIIMQNGASLYPGDVTACEKEKMLSQLQSAMENTSVHLITGSSVAIANKIANL